MNFLTALQADRLIAQIREEADAGSANGKMLFAKLGKLGTGAIPKILEAMSSADKRQTTTRQATANGPRVTVTGPFAPGTTTVSFGFELPHNGPTARLDQTWPAQVQGLELIAIKTGALDLHSPQMTSKQLTHQQGQPLVTGDVPAMAQGQSLSLDISGLPFHPRWPRYTALTAAGVIVSWGLWAAFVPTRRRAA
jgi:hypothetical protein